MTRAEQFFKAIFAKIDDNDRAYVKKYLNEAGEKLFFDMEIFDQAHSLAVARTLENFSYEGDRDFLIRLALLHDTGRKNVSVFDKVFCVVANAISKRLAKTLSKYFYSMYVYYNHPQIGAEFAKNAGYVKEAEIIRYHHKNIKNPSQELLLLKKADGMN